MTQNNRLQLWQGDVCKASKHGRPTGTTGQHRLYAGHPWQVLALDLMSPILQSTRKNNRILVLTNHFNRWVIPDASAHAVTPVYLSRPTQTKALHVQVPMQRIIKTCACNNNQLPSTLEYIKLFLYFIFAVFL